MTVAITRVDVGLKVAVTVAEMARMIGLSRARFYQLLGTTFPFPVHDVVTRRPFYTEEQQRICMEVRRRNSGIDGRPILFYSCRPTVPVSSRKRRAKTATDNNGPGHASIIEALRGLGLAVTKDQVAAVLKSAFPTGIEGIEEGEVIRRLFLEIRRQNSADNVRR
jgi:hypothetical protein